GARRRSPAPAARLPASAGIARTTRPLAASVAGFTPAERAGGLGGAPLAPPSLLEAQHGGGHEPARRRVAQRPPEARVRHFVRSEVRRVRDRVEVRELLLVHRQHGLIVEDGEEPPL